MYDPEDEWDVRESISKEEVPVSFCLERSYAYLYGLLGGGVLLSSYFLEEESSFRCRRSVRWRCLVAVVPMRG